MLIGLLMLLAPGVIFILSLPFSRRLKPGLCRLYRILGGIVVFAGSGISLYLAMYTGDQGGIGAFFFQIAVILVYAALSVALVILNWFLSDVAVGENESQETVAPGPDKIGTVNQASAVPTTTGGEVTCNRKTSSST